MFFHQYKRQMLYHFLCDPPVIFFTRGRAYKADGLKKMTFNGSADYRGFEALVCSSPCASKEGRVSVGVVIRSFQRWRDPSKRKESLVASASGRISRRRRAHVEASRPYFINTHVRWLPSCALDSKCNFSSAISSHREGGGLISNSKLFQYTDSALAEPG